PRSRSAEEEPVVGRVVVVNAKAKARRSGPVRHATLVVVVLRNRPVLYEVLVRLRHHVPVERKERVLVRPVRVHEPVFRNDVVRERRAIEAAGTRRIGANRQRIVNLVLTRSSKREQVREVTVEMLRVGRYGRRLNGSLTRVVTVFLVVA